MAQWAERIGIGPETTAKALVQLTEKHRVDEDTGRQLHEFANPALRDALMAVAAGRNGVDTARLGKWLRGKKGRIVSIDVPGKGYIKLRLETPGTTNGSARWRLAQVRREGG